MEESKVRIFIFQALPMGFVRASLYSSLNTTSSLYSYTSTHIDLYAWNIFTSYHFLLLLKSCSSFAS